jgi:hypothetical protein
MITLTDQQKASLYRADLPPTVYIRLDAGPFATLTVTNYTVAVGQTFTVRYGTENGATATQVFTCVASGPGANQFVPGTSNAECATNAAAAIIASLPNNVYAQGNGQYVLLLPAIETSTYHVSFEASSGAWQITLERLPHSLYLCSGNEQVNVNTAPYGAVPAWNWIESIGAVGTSLDPVTRSVSIGTLEVVLHGETPRLIFARGPMKGRGCVVYLGNLSTGTYANNWVFVGSYIIQDWIPEHGGIRVTLAEPLEALLDTKIKGTLIGMHPLAALRWALAESGLSSSQYSIESETTSTAYAAEAHWALARTHAAPMTLLSDSGARPSFLTNPVGSLEGSAEDGVGIKGFVDELSAMLFGTLRQNSSGVYAFTRYVPTAAAVRHIENADIGDFEVESMTAHMTNRVRVISTLDPEDEFILYGEEDTASVLRASPNSNSRNYDLDIPTDWFGLTAYLKDGLTDAQTTNMRVFGAPLFGFTGTRPQVTVDNLTDTYPTQRATDTISGTTRTAYLMITDGVNTEIVRATGSGQYQDQTADNSTLDILEVCPLSNTGVIGSYQDEDLLESTDFDPSIATPKKVVLTYQYNTIERGQLGTTPQTWTVDYLLPYIAGAVSPWYPRIPYIEVYDITIPVRMVQDRIERFANGIPICRMRLPFQHVDLELGDFITFSHDVYLNYTKSSASSLVVWEIIGKEIDVTGDSPGVNLRLGWVRDDATIPKVRVPLPYAPSSFSRFGDLAVTAPPVLGLPGDFTLAQDLTDSQTTIFTNNLNQQIISFYTGVAQDDRELLLGGPDYLTRIEMVDHYATAFSIYEGATTYFNISTVNSAETITIGNAGVSTDILIRDNFPTAFRVREGTNNYLLFDSTDAARRLEFGYDGALNYFLFRGTGYTGIGLTGAAVLPLARLHVRNADSTASVRSDTTLLVESSGTNFVNILSGNSAVQGIAFGSPSSNDRASFAFTGSSGRMGLLSAGSERIGIVGNNVLIRDLAGVAGDSTLHVFGTSGQSGTVDAPTGTVVTIENGAAAHLAFLTPNNQSSTIYFGDVDDNDVALISYSHSLNRLDIWSNTVNVAQITGTQITLGTTGVGFVWSGTGWTLNGTQGTAGQVLVSNGATTPTWTSAPSSLTVAGDVTGTLGATTVVDLTIASEARGDLLYRGASAWVRRAVGTVNQHLGSDGTDPTWEDNSSIAIAGQITGTLAASTLAIGTGIGSMLRRNAGDTAWEVVAVGGAGQVLTVVSGLPQWAAAAGGSTLDAAYDFGGAGAGRTINVDVNLPVFLSASHTSTSPLLHLRQADTGDAAIQFDIGATTTSWALGIDNSAGDVFKFSYASGAAATIGTGDVLTLTSGQVIGPAGTVGLPGLAVGTASTYGLYQTGSVLALSAAGALSLDVSATETNSQGRVRTIASGTAGAPAFWAGSDVGLGLYRYGTNTGALAAESLAVLRWDRTGIRVDQGVSTSGSPIALFVVGAANTTLTASTETSDVNFNLGRSVQWATGAIAIQRAIQIQRPTYAFVGASTITDAATFAIDNAPAAGTNATITKAWAMRIAAGASGFGAGAESLPGIGFTDERSGLYRASSRVIGMSVDVDGSLGAYRQTWEAATINFRPAGSGAVTSSLTATQALFPAGIETLPGIAFTGDSDTGIYPYAANGLAISCAGKFYVSVSESEFTVRTNTTPVARLTIGSAGQWTLGASGTGTTGQVFTSGGASGIPTWTTPSGLTFPILAPDGTDAAPSYSFADDTNTGIRGSSTVDGQMHFVSNGTTRMLLDAAFMDFTVPFRGGNGLDSAPTFSFSARTTTGIYSSAADTINFSAGSASRMQIDTNSIDFNVVMLGGNGSDNAPTYSFASDTDCGLYYVTTNDIALSAGGNAGVELTASNINLANATDNQYVAILGTGDFRLGSQIRFTERAGDPVSVANTGFLYTKDVSTVTQLFYETSAGTVYQLTPSTGVTFPLLAPDGIDTAPSYSFADDTNTGIYSSAADTISFACGGTARALLNTTTLDFSVSMRGGSGSDGTPTYSFSSATTQGMYSASTTLLAVSVAGEFRQSWDSSADVISFRPGGASPSTVHDLKPSAFEFGANGTAALPLLTRTGDVDTGAFFPGGGEFGISANGVEIQRWNPDGIEFLRNATTGAEMRLRVLEETVNTTSGSSVFSTNNALLFGALVLGFSWRIQTTVAITSGSSFSVRVNGGENTDPILFDQLTLTAGTAGANFRSRAITSTAGGELEIYTSGTFTAGAIKFRIYYVHADVFSA